MKLFPKQGVLQSAEGNERRPGSRVDTNHFTALNGRRERQYFRHQRLRVTQLSAGGMKNYNCNIESANFLLESEIAIAREKHFEFLLGPLQ
jgi:hypothetical protein